MSRETSSEISDIAKSHPELTWDKPCLIITIGLPASGKTTWAKLMCNQQNASGSSPLVVRVNRDDIRLELGFKFDPRREDEVTDIQQTRIRAALHDGCIVIVDDTHLNPKYIEERRKMAEVFGVPLYIVDDFLKVPFEKCLERDLKRGEAAVGKDVLEQLYFRHWSYQDKPVNHGPYEAVICDLDGTLALFKGNPYERDFSKDTLNKPVAHVLDWVHLWGGQIIITSGRTDKFRDMTQQWLAANGIKYDVLHMRREGNHERDTTFKRSVYMHTIQGKYHVNFVLDDRPSVCRMWRAELGLTVFQVAPNIEF